MSKKTIRERMLAAIEKDPHKKDFRKIYIFGPMLMGSPIKTATLIF